MAKWKELGEVPDSDDESLFAGEEPGAELPQAAIADSEAINTLHDSVSDQNPNIWDIPTSSQPDNDTNGHDVFQSPRIEPPSFVTTSRQDLLSSPLSSAPQIIEEELEASPSVSFHGYQSSVRDAPDPVTTDSRPALLESNPRTAEASRESSPGIFEDQIFAPVDLLGLEHDESIARRESARFCRSLRPRKPIQEHPYLLESAQYSKLFKSHGVRPIRLPAQEPSTVTEEEDSQEKAYQEDDTQLTNALRDEASQDESQEIQQQRLADDEADELALDSRTHFPSPSSRLSKRVRTAPPHLVHSSQNDEELPSLDDLAIAKRIQKSGMFGKRKVSPKQTIQRKLLKSHRPIRIDEPKSPTRPVNESESPPSPPQTSPALVATPIIAGVARRSAISSLTPKPSSAVPSQSPTPVLHITSPTAIDLTNASDLESSDDEANLAGGSMLDPEQDELGSSSPERGLDLAFKRRIRGVLPASWVRLDLQIGREPTRKAASRRSPERSPEKTSRKGVAQRRRVAPEPDHNTPFHFDNDDSDNDETILRSNDNMQLSHNPDFSIFEDDAGSVVEEDQIDRMLPGRKRSSRDVTNEHRPAKRIKTQNTFKGKTGTQRRQQSIRGLLGRSESATGANVKKTSRSDADSRTLPSTNRAGTSNRWARPPKLSILDVVEPNAPQFIKIAARAASRQPDKGRSSPARKHIDLGVRRDNIEALEVLQHWREGKIRARLPSAAPKPRGIGDAQPLRSISHNGSILPRNVERTLRVPKPVTSNRFARSRVLAKQTSLNAFVTTQPGDISLANNIQPVDSDLPVPAPIRARITGGSEHQSKTSRPAQLETADEHGVSRRSFHTQKKMLDALFRRSQKELPSNSEALLEPILGPQMSSVQHVHAHDSSSSRPSVIELERSKRLRRPRKTARPRQVDTTAPQYTHANDPLPGDIPVEMDLSSVPNATAVALPASKLQGLGPFGTHYTQHFEVFPLENGVFFHGSTLIGQGKLAKVFSKSHTQFTGLERGYCNLILDGQHLRWGPWSDQASSELGLLFDWICDKLQPCEGVRKDDSLTTTKALDFILEYVQDHISFLKATDGRIFLCRVLEVMPCLLERLLQLVRGQSTDLQEHVEILTRCVLIVSQAVGISKELNSAESFQLEELLKATAQLAIQYLLQQELDDVKEFYVDLQRDQLRDGGIKNDRFSIVGWVVVMKALQGLQLPRGGLWEIVSAVMLPPDLPSISDAQVFEKLWRNLFTLLPLGEFDNAGNAVARLRHINPLEGWSMPQKLLSRVFELYKSNQRQSPTFNDYCRTIVGRCHYLIEQWGWRKNSVIIGTIFDFFASQDLSHLRNEENYRSPQFLEALPTSPSLAVLPEDRCFHIFLKLLAMTVQRLRRYGLLKDVRNLIARVLPNHDRQYLKERDIHENELAALRNHHDLLCTLFWCAPHAFRPSVHTLEKLVTPGSSHKEACLINLRAWNQLARFVVASGEEKTVYKPFADWHDNVFRQVLEQYSSVESDIQQQFLRMSKDAANGVSPELVKNVVAMNKRAATDILHFSLKAGLDAMRHATSLAMASLVINTYQLEEVFRRFSISPPDFDWCTLQVALNTVDDFLGRIEKFREEHTPNSGSSDSWHEEDAIMILDRHIGSSFFAMARTILASCESDSLSSPNDIKALCLEQTIFEAGRLAALFLHTKVTRTSAFFSPGKYGLFESQPGKLRLKSRKWLCLFIATLLDRNVVDFEDLKITTLELFLTAIVKPYRGLAYENRLAEAMKRIGSPYLRDVRVFSSNPDYPTNQELFEHALSRMRQLLRSTGSGDGHRLQAEFSRAARGVMQQVKADLKDLVEDPPAHTLYIKFVRSIISVIKTNDICPIDPFFCEDSRDYSPSTQDPRLQTAAILSYGLKLEDGDTRAVPALFWFLYASFKLALAKGKVTEERAILASGMQNEHVFSFVLSKMMPAIIQTAIRIPDAWLLLETYVGAMEDLLTKMDEVRREMGTEAMTGLLALIKFTTAAIHHLAEALGIDGYIRPEYLSTLARATRLLNLFIPSVLAYFCNTYEQHFNEDSASPTLRHALEEAIDGFTAFTRSAEQYLSESLKTINNGGVALNPSSAGLRSHQLFSGVHFHAMDHTLEHQGHVSSFAEHLLQDIPKTWIVSTAPMQNSLAAPAQISAADHIAPDSVVPTNIDTETGAGSRTETTFTVRGPARPPATAGIASSTQSGQGTKVAALEVGRLARDLLKEVREWERVFDRTKREGRRRKGGASTWRASSAEHEDAMLF